MPNLNSIRITTNSATALKLLSFVAIAKIQSPAPKFGSGTLGESCDLGQRSTVPKRDRSEGQLVDADVIRPKTRSDLAHAPRQSRPHADSASPRPF